MTKVYITFGQVHVHSINGKTLDKDCVAVINCNSYGHGRTMAFEYLDGVFHNCYSHEEYIDGKVGIEYFPRGLIEIN